LVEHIDILNVSRKKNYGFSYRNGRKKHGFIYTVRGSMRDSFTGDENEVFEVKEGELIFIPKGCAYHATYLEKNTEIKIIQFDILKGELPEYLSKPKKLALHNADALINEFFLPEINPSAERAFYYLFCLYRLLWQIDEHQAALPTKYKKLRPALTELSQHFEKNEPVAYYAELCDMSEVTFRRSFREYLGMSPISYRNDIRLKNAQAMLQSGEYNVSEVAEHCGFSNLSFFIRLYKKKYGITPKKE